MTRAFARADSPASMAQFLLGRRGYTYETLCCRRGNRRHGSAISLAVACREVRLRRPARESPLRRAPRFPKGVVIRVRNSSRGTPSTRSALRNQIIAALIAGFTRPGGSVP